jgi:thymidine kinase
MQAGYLSLHMGCMRADKSGYATKKATKYADLGESVLYIRSSLDVGRTTNGGNGESFTSHSSSNVFLSSNVHTATCENLSSLRVEDYNMLVVDEAQFFDDIVPVVLDWVDQQNKTVYVVGLDSSFKRTEIGHLLKLIPHADYYEKFTAKCSKCLVEYSGDGSKKYQNAIFTLLESKGGPNSIIHPGNEGYVPVCRYHYNKLNTIC